jgi:hypothetical protein
MQSLQWIKTLADGSIEAIYYWKTGWQILTFRNRKDFDRCQKEISNLD